uniref:SWI/SNF-related matrix-associated actin-dependent regulator of chromatin subfamily A containing DEAD/H box 1 homolog n=1 Tax=Angiostrongylus cantonensis TaxID=6313 RepID=A0A0K0D0U8_ANGCA
MESTFVDAPAKKRSRKAVILSDDSENENEEHPSSVAALTTAASEGTKRDRKRKIFSGDKCVDGDEKGSESGEESDASDDSDDGDERYSHNEVLDTVARDCLIFFNTASRTQLLATPRVTDRIATKVISERPFETFADLESAIATIPRGIGVLNSYMEFLENRGILEKILDDCKDHSLAVAAEFEHCTHRNLKPKLLESRCSLHEYQNTGLNWLVMMHEKGFNCILGDEMGLGKTIQLIAFIAYLKEAGIRGPHLIVVPSSTIENWMTEFTKWCPKISVLTYYGKQLERKQLRRMAEKRKANTDVILTTYNMISSKHDDKKFFKNFSLNYVIYDEGHMLRNCSTDRYRSLMKVKGKHKILMTGTPLQNNLIELISLMYFVMTDIFTKYCDDIAQLLQHFKQHGPALESASSAMYQKDRIEQAKQILQPYMLRRLKVQVLSHLPEKHENLIEVEMLGSQKELYETLLDSVHGMDNDTNNAYGALVHLRQAANHPLLRRVHYTESLVDKVAKTLCAEEKAFEKKRWENVAEELSFQSDFQIHKLCEKFFSTKKYLLDEGLALESGKCRLLDQLLPKIKAQGDKVLIFSQFTSMLDILEVYLRIRKYTFRRLDGSTPVMERQEMINQYNNDPELFVFLLSTRAGGLGINLTSANHIIIHDIDFNPYNDKQ